MPESKDYAMLCNLMILDYCRTCDFVASITDVYWNYVWTFQWFQYSILVCDLQCFCAKDYLDNNCEPGNYAICSLCTNWLYDCVHWLLCHHVTMGLFMQLKCKQWHIVFVVSVYRLLKGSFPWSNLRPKWLQCLFSLWRWHYYRQCNMWPWSSYGSY